MSALDDAWDQFLEYISEARKRLDDRWAPVALICLQAEADSSGAVNLKPWNDAAALWPAEFPVDQRGPLLARLAKPYGEGTVLR